MTLYVCRLSFGAMKTLKNARISEEELNMGGGSKGAASAFAPVLSAPWRRPCLSMYT